MQTRLATAWQAIEVFESGMKHKAPLPFARRFTGLLEELEPRILFSADAAALILSPSDLPAASLDQAVQQMAPSPSIVSASLSGAHAETSEQRVELVLVDSRVPDAKALVGLIEQQSSESGRVLEIHWLSNESSGVDQITQILSGRQDISALHIISHGSDGSLTLGQDTLDSQSLTSRASDLSQWSAALSTDADILLYGCNVAATEVGFSVPERFVSAHGCGCGRQRRCHRSRQFGEVTGASSGAPGRWTPRPF